MSNGKEYKYTLPKCVAERMVWAVQSMKNNGLTPLLTIEIILAYDEEFCKELYELEASGSWLEVTKEFKGWRDGRMSRYKQYMVLHAFVNGYEVAV